MVYAVLDRPFQAHCGRFIGPSEAMNDSEVKRKVLFRILGSPLVLAPFLAGMTAMTAFLAAGQRVAFGLFAGLAGALGTAGALVTRLVLRGDQVARQITEEAEREDQRKRQRQLDQLDEHLTTADDDPRPEAALRDLRALVSAFEDIDDQEAGVHLHSVVEIRGRVHQLFRQCVHSLEQTKRLWETAQKLNTAAARNPILKQRERIIAEVQATIKQLSAALIGLQNLETGDQSTAQLNRLREELDQSLEVARNVDVRIQSLLGRGAFDSLDPLSQPQSKTKG